MNINAVTRVDRMNQNLLPSAESVGNIEKNPTSDYYTINPSVAAMEVIDLLSPSPPAHSCMVSKCQQANVECIEMIELSESETEASPEHTRKARELRSFLASIREDLSK